MEASEKTFRHSLGNIVVMFLVYLFFGAGVLYIARADHFLFMIAGIVLLGALFYATISVKISNEEITTTRLLSSKSLRWSEIARVDTRGQKLRLHNYDDDLMLFIDTQLPGYTEILDIIFDKRSDLFDTEGNTAMSVGWLGNLTVLGIGLVITAIPIFVYVVAGEFDNFLLLLFFAVGVGIIVSWLLSPKRLKLENSHLVIGYFFKEVSQPVSNISSISLERRSTKSRYTYFVQINLRSGKNIKLPTFQQEVQLTYQILKRWHKKAVSN